MKRVAEISAYQEGLLQRSTAYVFDLQDMILRIQIWPARLDTLKKAGMKQREFCTKHGLKESYISNLMSGRVTPSRERFDKVEDALKAEGV